MKKIMFDELTWPEMEAYLKKADVIFLPVGVVEMHGGLPLGCEYHMPLAVAKVMAERVGGLVFPHVANSYAGGTQSGKGTINLPIRVGADYIKAIIRELHRSGFRRVILLSYHGPAAYTCALVTREIFEETRLPVVYIDLIKFLHAEFKGLARGERWLGPLKLVGKLNTFQNKPYRGKRIPQPDCITQLERKGLCFGFRYTHPSQHSWWVEKKLTEKEIHERADAGIKAIHRMVDAIDIESVLKNFPLMPPSRPSKERAARRGKF